ncbi:MAG: glycosyltransferase family 39 protein [Anaerolineales bacterium]|nr:glycosyltransferase family 39 protein [Anaerolineales bacterium]
MKYEIYTRPRSIILLFLLLALIAPSHIIANDRVVTIDEPWWVISGSNYYYALTHRDFSNTIYDYHPAVTTTWVVTAGMLSYFPQYRAYGQGYFDVRKPHFEEFLRENGKEALTLVRNSRLFQSLIILGMALTAFFFLQFLVGQTSAFLAIALFMTAPYFLGHARLLNHEGMLSVFVLVSFLGMQVYLNKGRKWTYLLVSGAAFGLAQLTKSSSIVVAGLVGLMLFVTLFKRDEKSIGRKTLEAGKVFALWLISAALVYVILWPGMWVAPDKMLAGVYGNAFSYAFQGARLEVVVEEVQSSGPSLVLTLRELAGYVRGWAALSTPVTWTGFALAVFMIASKDKERLPAPVKSTLVYLMLLGGLFILLFSVARGRNSLHYILSSYVCFDVVAGIGWGYALLRVRERLGGWKHVYAPALMIGVLTLIQIGSGIPHAPYYFTYHNPIINGVGTSGYGEGYDQAADYLMQKTNAHGLRAYVYNGMGTFSYFFEGETLVFKRVHLLDDSFLEISAELRSSDYLVMYSAVRTNHPETGKMFAVLEEYTEPEKIIFIKGLEYFRVYRVADFPESMYAALEGMQR